MNLLKTTTVPVTCPAGVPVTGPMSRRLFAVFWWLVIVGSLGGAVLFAERLNEDAQDPSYFDVILNPGPLGPLPANCGDFCFHIYSWAYHYSEHSAYLLASLLLPYATLTIVRWVITGHWRFGPRW
jgi:hypothetical protein